MLFAVGATARWADDGITANALMPGGIATKLQRRMHPGNIQRWIDESGSTPRLETAEQRPATSVLPATSPLLEGGGGRYFEDRNGAEVIPERGQGTTSGVAPYTVDPENADRLWEASPRMLG